MTMEDLLKIWLDTIPSGVPPMWETLKDGNRVLFTRPAKVMERDASFMPYHETDGVHYQWQEDGKWINQRYQATFEYFFDSVIPKMENIIAT